MPIVAGTHQTTVAVFACSYCLCPRDSLL